MHVKVKLCYMYFYHKMIALAIKLNFFRKVNYTTEDDNITFNNMVTMFFEKGAQLLEDKLVGNLTMS